MIRHLYLEVTDTGLEQENDAIGQRQGWRLGIGLALKISRAISLTGCFAISFAGALWAIACSHPRVLAQNIVTDGTLGAEQPLTGPIYTIPQGLGQTDDSNTNLFHSFRRFNLSNIEQAIFQSDPNIRNIFARVTGGSPSEINGLIYTQEPNVNLYFLNPYGILFGPNAELDVGGTGRGSFIATTVDALVWDGGQFSATQPQGRDSLLTLRGDPGGFLSSIRTPGPITNSGATLRVYNNESLLLVGGNVTLNGGSIEAFGGRVEIGAVSGSGTIPLNTENNFLSLGAIPLDVARGDVLLTNAARIDASTGLRPGDGIGSISIQAKSLFLERGAQLDSSTFGQGNAGDVVIEATDSVFLTGTNTTIFNNVEPNGSGDGGNVWIETGSLSLTNGAQIQTLVREAQNDDQSAGQGNAGNVRIFATGSVEIAGVSSDGLPSAIFSSVGSGVNSNADNTNIGNAGNIEIIAGSVSVSDRGLVESKVNANNTGDAGNIQISAGSVFLDTNAKLNTDNDGSGLAGNTIINASSLISIRGNSEIISQSNNNDLNRGFGSIQITAIDGSVLINNSIFNTQNGSSGFAGDISVTASERVSIENKSRIFSTGIVGQILIGASAYTSISPQVVSIDNSELNTDNSSAFSTNTDTDIAAGNILIQANEFISFANGANLTTSTSQKGDAGYVVLQAERIALANSNI
jgi:filamentous hemagglutinin family protein